MMAPIDPQAKRDLQQLPGVTGVGEGYRERDGALTREVAAVVYVAAKRPLADIPVPERIPAQIGAARTDVQEATFEAMLAPLEQGDTIGPELAPQVGTLGMIVPHGAEGYALTNEHVVWAQGQAVGNTVKRYGGDRIGRVTHALDPATGMGDAALVRLELRGPRQTAGTTVVVGATGTRERHPYLGLPDYDFGVRGVTNTLRSIGTPALGATCWKVGRSTGFTSAFVASWKADILVSFGSRGAWTFHDQVVIRPLAGASKPITLHGDSGSVWCAGDRALALCFAGDTISGTYSVATPLPTVFAHLLGPEWPTWSPLLHQ